MKQFKIHCKKSIVIAIIFLIIWIWALVNCTSREDMDDNKIAWILVIVLGGGIGAIIYLFGFSVINVDGISCLFDLQALYCQKTICEIILDKNTMYSRLEKTNVPDVVAITLLGMIIKTISFV